MKWLITLPHENHALESSDLKNKADGLRIPEYIQYLMETKASLVGNQGDYIRVDHNNGAVDIRYDPVNRVVFIKQTTRESKKNQPQVPYSETSGLIFEKIVRVAAKKVEWQNNLPFAMTAKVISSQMVLRHLKVKVSEYYARKTHVLSSSHQSSQGHYEVTSTLTGRVVQVNIQPGSQVKKTDCVAIIEAMKMENKIFAGENGIVKEVHMAVGKRVTVGNILCSIKLTP
ncbi:MAG: acetyl-CoA carboxylase biotin carboxyl carrier protein subunit [Proteobacteria bacterium]|nr:acetyl-CoA carboxylase biotin carboxyl carrier protein subunit [Pseudomonadota bacterium]